MTNRNKQQSFTLIELLVVIVIIGILAGVIMISTSSSIDKANIAKSKVFEESIQNNLAANMVSAWDADHVTKGTTWVLNDKWGNNNGTFYDGTVTTCSTTACPQIVNDKNMGNVLSFDGVDDYIDLGGALNFTKEDSFTFSIWIKRTGTVSGTTKVAGILMNGTSFLGYGIDYYEIGNQIRCGTRNSGENNTIEVTPSNNLLDWHYVVFSYEPSSLTGIKLYLNGIFKGSRSSVGIIALNNTTLKIAPNNTLGGDNNYFPGVVNNAKVYNVALSSSQIKQNYIAGLNSMLSNGNISNEEYNERINELARNKND
ncbi:MAG TPA: prepilin-type N-terminal cleavage/methylation domain-containing protein [Candidatus Pacearchaeota archaeon]|nr:prepilin-type N-terminal cleavage/methylation domain-containing protein [Candidatus Pacearchaeota archaeon]